MPDETLEPDDIDLPTKEIDPEESVADRMTDNVRNDVGPSRYFQKDANGNPTEDWSDVFERVGQNVAVPEAVHHDIPISVSKEHLADWVSDEKAKELFFNPSHPSRNNPDPDVTKQYRDLDEEIAKYIDYEKLTDVTESAPGSLHDRLTDEAERFERMMAEQRFMPNTPTLINAGSELQMLSACFVYYPGDSLIDDPGDRSSILEVAKEAAATFKGGGGVGYPLHLMRPKGDRISSTGGVSSGPMSFAQIYNTVCGTIQQGGVRRGAQMAIMHSEHPDVGRFCVAKRDEENLSNFNISVGLTDRFLEAVKNDEMYTLVDPTADEAYIDHEPFETVPESLHFYDPKYEDAWNDQYNKPGEDEHGKAIESNFWRDYYDEMGDPEAFDEFRDRIDLEVGEPLELPARFIWQMLIDGSHHLGEPGFYYIDKANDEHSFDVEENYGEYLHSTNPCFTGDTLVATADGRGGIPIEELTTEDEVPIYTRSEDGDANVALATNIRKTRTDADLVTVKTDGDATVTCTPDHPIWTRNRGWVNAGNLEAGDSLHMLYEREHTEGYRAVEWTGCDTPHNLEHRMVVDGILDMDLAGDAVHHKNGDKTDNRPENLTVMDPSEHGSMHARDISGDNNPIYDLKERGEFEDYKARNSFYQTAGDDNPMSGERATVVCQECGEEFKNVTNTHLKAAHDMTTDEYREKYPEKPMVKLDSNHTVTAVEPAGSADVYDLEVPGTHNFYASNEGGEYINVHNCGEQSLTDGEPCNLGHVNLSLMADEDAPTFAEWCSDDGRSRTSSHVRDYLEVGLDMELLEETTKTGTRFLDNVITMNDFPLEKNREAANNKRKIGVGIMGFHQLCLQLGIEYGTDESYALAEEIMRLVDRFAVEESYILADERGPFERYEESKWADPQGYPEWFEKHAHNDPEAFADGYPVRNHNMTTVAPTGTTSMIGNTTGGCEPIYNVANFKNVSDDVQGEGMLIEMDDLFLDTIEANGLDVDAVKAEIKRKLDNDEFTGTDDLETVPDAIGELFVTSGDLSVEQHIRVQAAFQTYCDSSISKTVNIRNSASLADIGEAIGLACELGCKGGTIYRIGSRTEEVKTTSTTGGGVSIKEADEDDLLEELDERGVEIPDTVTVADD